MVQKSIGKRGRPRAYDPDRALAQATSVFWDRGYAATSLDELSAATKMNRPSLYGGFGDKRALYGATLERYRRLSSAAIDEELGRDSPLGEALARLYDRALSIYYSGETAARGCYLIGTAVTEAVRDEETRALLCGSLRAFEAAFEARLRQAGEEGELPHGSDPAMLAKFASAILYFLAIRSRAGEPREELERVAAAGIGLICGGPQALRRRPATPD